MARRRSGEKTPKQLAAELARQREKYPQLFPKTDGVSPIIAPPAPLYTHADGFPCRLHGVPWKKCPQCSARRTP
jgi:hypothetical protein